MSAKEAGAGGWRAGEHADTGSLAQSGGQEAAGGGAAEARAGDGREVVWVQDAGQDKSTAVRLADSGVGARYCAYVCVRAHSNARRHAGTRARARAHTHTHTHTGTARTSTRA